MYDNLVSVTDNAGRIKDLIVKCYLIPTDEPESDGTFMWDKTILVTVRISSGDTTGFGYTYADLSTARFINDHLKDLIIGRSVFNSNELRDEMRSRARNLGLQGIASMAVSAVDIALWDLKAKILNVPLTLLSGINRNKTAVYGSGGFTSYSNTKFKKQFEGWMNLGITMFKMKVGRDKEKDRDRIKYARDVIGEKNSLFIDANGAYFPQEALKYCRQFEEYNISWFEEPVSSDDLTGLKFVRSHVPAGIDIAAGEYGYTTRYFNAMLSSGAVDVLQADATRCGGITGFLKAGVLCEGYNIPFSAHTAPSVHLHACCSASKAVHIEYFHDHARIEEMFFDGYIKPEDGFLAPHPGRAGLGIEFKEKDAEKYLISY